MRILRKLFVLAIAALFLAQFVGIAGGQDVNGRDAQKPRRTGSQSRQPISATSHYRCSRWR